MKIFRLVCLVLIFSMVFSLFACNKKDKNDSENNIPVVDENDGKVVYVYSVNSKSIHLPTCHFAASIKEDYRKETTDIMKLIENEYELCKFCFPPEHDEEPDEEEPEEDPNQIPFEQATYVINKNSQKIHEKDCQHLETTNQKNMLYTDLTLEELLDPELELIPCGTCLPDEYKKYKEEHPEVEE